MAENTERRIITSCLEKNQADRFVFRQPWNHKKTEVARQQAKFLLLNNTNKNNQSAIRASAGIPGIAFPWHVFGFKTQVDAGCRG